MSVAARRKSSIASYSAIYRPVLLYDARCSVCRRFIALTVGADRRGTLRIAPLQSSHGDAVRREYPEFAAMDSALWVSGGTKPLAYSNAVLAALDYLGGPWRWLSRAGRLIPVPIRDWIYRTFAANRRYFGWFGLDELDNKSARRMLPDDHLKGGSHDA